MGGKGRRNIPTLIGVRVASVAGDWLYSIAIAWFVISTTHSSVILAAVSISQSIPFVIFGLFFAGSLDGLKSKKRTLALIDATRAVLVLGFPALAFVGSVDAPWLIILAAILAGLDAVFTPGLQSFLPEIVQRDRLPQMHAILDTTQRMGRILGPGLSGLLLLVIPITSFFIVDSATYAVSAVGLMSLVVIVPALHKVGEVLEPAGSSAAASGMRHKISVGSRVADARASWAFVREFGTAGRLLLLRNVQNVVWAIYIVGLPVLVSRRFHGGGGTLGFLIASYAAGQLVGNWLTVRLRSFQRPISFLEGGWALCGLGFAALGLSPTVWVGVIALVVAGLGSSAGNVAADGYLGYTIPADRQGRVFALQSTANELSRLIGVALFGVLLAVASPIFVFIAAGSVMVAISILSRLRPLRADRTRALEV